jgi:hypothetical protein
MPLLNYTSIRHFIAYLSLHILSGSSVVQQLKVKLEVNRICWTYITHPAQYFEEHFTVLLGHFYLGFQIFSLTKVKPLLSTEKLKVIFLPC